MRILLINKSDNTGGAAMVSFRLLEALREQGHEANMLVVEKITDSPYVIPYPNKKQAKWKFLLERLKIFIANGFNRSTLFKIDTGEEGLPLHKLPIVKEADALLINWVNQGMVSLKGLGKLCRIGKPVIITMHDMWWLTGICHHAGTCTHFLDNCGNCYLLGKKQGPHDLSFNIHLQKSILYLTSYFKKTAFVAVSSWLKDKARESSLLKTQRVEVIPNLFKLPININRQRKPSPPYRILFGAARLDDPIKGLDTLVVTTEILREKYPSVADNLEIAVFGSIKNPELLTQIQLPLINLGILRRPEALYKAYSESDIVVSASSYETLPGTMVEAQALGCIPVSFNQGGQTDIIISGETGFIVNFEENPSKRSANLTEGILNAIEILKDEVAHKKFVERMQKNVVEKFSPEKIVDAYIHLIKSLDSKI